VVEETVIEVLGRDRGANWGQKHFCWRHRWQPSGTCET